MTKNRDRNLKVAEGTYRRSRKPNAPTAKNGTPRNPFRKKTVAYRVWKKCVAELKVRGSMSETYSEMLEAYCRQFELLRQAQRGIDKHGVLIESPQGWKKNPCCTVIAECTRLIRSLGSEFGFSPASIQNTHSSGTTKPLVLLDADGKTG